MCYKNQSKYSVPIKVLPYPEKMDRSTVHELIGSNKLAANEKKNLDLINNIIGITRNGTTQNTINCGFGLPNCCDQELRIIVNTG